MEENILKEFINHGSEERNLEYKGDVSWKDKSPQAKIIKTIMALSNIPDGGTIVIGVHKNGEEYLPNGLSEKNFKTYTQDGVSEKTNEFADPYVEISVKQIIDNDSNFVIIQVKEFSDIPIICKKNGPEGLQRGGIYIRPRRKIETVIIPSQVEMRELIRSAVDKGIISLQKRLHTLGISGSVSDKRDKEKFDSQMGDLI